MTDWIDFNFVFENLVTYFTGSYLVLALGICMIFFITMLVVGLDIRYATVFTIPLVGAFLVAGWFGATGWISNVVLIIAAVFYGFAILKITN